MEQIEKTDDYKIILSALRNLINDEPNREAKWEKDFIFATGHYRIEYHAKQGVFVIEQRLFDRVDFDPEQDPWQPMEETTRKWTPDKDDFRKKEQSQSERGAVGLEQPAMP